MDLSVRRLAKLVLAGGDSVLAPPSGPRILIYHQVGRVQGRQMEVEINDFRRQLDWLCENKDVVPVEKAVAEWEDGESDQLAVLSFDDGYASVYSNAFPMLRERGLPFTLYLSTALIEEGRASAIDADPLTWEMVSEMMESGLMTIGAHTHNHVDLRHADAITIEDELTRSDDLIQRRIGLRPRHFAYPWGYWSSVAEPLVQRRYQTAVLGGSPSPTPRPSRYRLHRYPVQLSDGYLLFKLRVSGGLRLEEWVRRRLRGYSGP